MAGVKTRLAADTVASVRSLDEIGTVTSSVGAVVSQTENVSVPPDSVVVRLFLSTATPASLSMLRAPTLPVTRLLKLGSALAVALNVIVYGWVPSTMPSSTPVMVTTCGTFQSAGVKVSMDGLTVPSPRSVEARLMVTLAVGLG